MRVVGYVRWLAWSDVRSRYATMIPKRRASGEGPRALFKRTLRSRLFYEGLFGEAIRFLEASELPQIWLPTRLAGLRKGRALVTNERLLLFRAGCLHTGELELEADYPLDRLLALSPILSWYGSMSLDIALAEDGDRTIATLCGLAGPIAHEASRLLTLLIREGSRAAGVGLAPRARPRQASELRIPLLTVGGAIGMIVSAVAACAILVFVPDLLLRLGLLGLIVFMVGSSCLGIWASKGDPRDSTPHGALVWVILLFFVFGARAIITPAHLSSRDWQADRVIERRGDEISTLLGAMSRAERVVFAWFGRVSAPAPAEGSRAAVASPAESSAALRDLKQRLWVLSALRMALALAAIATAAALVVRVRQRASPPENGPPEIAWSFTEAFSLWSVGVSCVAAITLFIPMGVGLVRSVRTGLYVTPSLPPAICMLAWLPALVTFCVIRRHCRSLRPAPASRMRAGFAILLGAIAMGYWGSLLGGEALTTLAAWLGLRSGSVFVRQSAPLILGSPSLLVTDVLLVVLVAPVFEELAFRAGLYRALRTVLTPAKAIPLSAVAFALVHGFSALELIVVFWGGVVYACVYEKTRRLWPSVAVHAVVNAFAVLTTLLLFRT